MRILIFGGLFGNGRPPSLGVSLGGRQQARDRSNGSTSNYRQKAVVPSRTSNLHGTTGTSALSRGCPGVGGLSTRRCFQRERSAGRRSASRGLSQQRSSHSGRHSSTVTRAAGGMGAGEILGALPGGLLQQSMTGALVLDMGIQLIGWGIACSLKTEKIYDLFGSLAFVSCSLLAYLNVGTALARQTLCTGMVVAWALRLGTFLFVRVIKDGGDRRFDEVKYNPPKYLIYWTLQGVWVWVSALPLWLVCGTPRQPGLYWADYLSLGIWAVGFVMEVTADLQKRSFKADPANKGKFINCGLWSVSRHPNYFGEIMQWVGVAGVALAMKAGPGVSAAALVSPLFVTLLLTKVSGIPMLEKYADDKWGNEAAYQTYKRNTPVLVPFTSPSKSD